jgi:hypothetical protein
MSNDGLSISGAKFPKRPELSQRKFNDNVQNLRMNRNKGDRYVVGTYILAFAHAPQNARKKKFSERVARLFCARQIGSFDRGVGSSKKRRHRRQCLKERTVSLTRIKELKSTR